MASRDSSNAVAKGWRPVGAALAATVVFMAVAFWGTVQSLATLWMHSDSYGHGVFAVPIALYAVWLMRRRLKVLAPTPWPLAIVALLGASLAWALASLAGIAVGEQLSLAAMLALVILTFTGPRITWLLGFPIGYLMLAIPVWDLLIPPLQYQTAHVTTAVLRAAGVPIYLEGIYISIPSGNFVIAEVCAGLRYLMAMASIGAFYAFLNGLTVSAGIGFFFLSLGWAILFNWIRVVGIIGIGHISEMQSSLVHDHYTFGWILFAVAMVPLFYAGRWFALAPDNTAKATDMRPAPRPGRLVGVAAIVVAAILAGPAAKHLLGQSQYNGPFVLTWPASSDSSWQKITADSNRVPWNPRFGGSAWSEQAAYRSASGDEVRTYAAVYGRQSQGRELINTQNTLYDSALWKPIRQSVWKQAPAEIGGAVREVVVRSRDSGQSRVIWYVYRAGGAFHTSTLRVKLSQIIELLSGNASGAVMAVSAEGGVGMEEIRGRLANASAALFPKLLKRMQEHSVR
jgi:exosortase A